MIVIILATPVASTQYEIQPLRNNPGLFYAKVEPLRITSNIIYFRKIRQWADHIDIKLNHLAESSKQFIKIVEAAREKRLHPLLPTKEQLQEIITKIHFKLSEYEFPIPTSHVRAEELSKLGKTDVRISVGRLPIAIDIPLQAGYQLYEIYAHPVYQQISPNTTGSIYIIPKTPYIVLANDERNLLLVRNEGVLQRIQ